jgi:hypothetical protein
LCILHDEDVAVPFRLYNEAVVEMNATVTVGEKIPKTAEPPTFQPWERNFGRF